MLDPVAFVLAVVGLALVAGLWAATMERPPDLHRLARELANKTSRAAQGLAARTDLEPTTIGLQILAMCRFEIGELARAATRDEKAAIAQEQRLRAACVEVGTKVAADARQT